MSFNVMIVGEDPTDNGYILQPLVERLLVGCGRRRANVQMLPSPRTQGYAHAKGVIKGSDFHERYRHRDLVLFLPDADGRGRARRDELDSLEQEVRQAGMNLLCCAAEQEVETWLLAGHYNKLDRSWQEIRNDRSIKENLFKAFLQRYGDDRAAGGGRTELMRETLGKYSGLLKRCPELAELEERIRRQLR